MKVNYEFYSENENIILEEKFPEKLNKIKNNILCWYKFVNTDEILQIGFDFNITKLLCEKVSKVTVVEQNIEKVKRLSSELEKYENLEIIVGTFDNIILKQKYDYAIFIGSFDNASVYINSINPHVEILNIVKKYINKTGKILIATDNKFAMRYFAGHCEKSTENAYTSLTGNFGSNTKLFGKNEIIDILKSCGFVNLNFYYPLPNYSIPNIIFSDKYLPTKENMFRYTPYYNKRDVIKYSEILAFIESINNGFFDIFANSYLIESSLVSFESDIKFISFNNTRLENFRLMTIMGSDKVYKLPLENVSMEHYNRLVENIKDIEKLKINQIEKLSDNNIVSDFIKEETLDIIIIKYLKQKNIEKAKEVIDEYISYLKDKLVELNDIEKNIFKSMNIEINEDISKLSFLKNGYWDMIFQNIFCIKNQMYVFDQEWRNDNVPLEFILYRGFKILFAVANIDEDTRNKLYDMYNITSYFGLFEKLERKLQEIVNDNEMQEIYTYRTDNDVIASLTQDVIALNKRIEDIIIQKDNEINNLKIENNKGLFFKNIFGKK